MHKIIQNLDPEVVIIKHKLEEKEIIKSTNTVEVPSKYTILNNSEMVLHYLMNIQEYFLNSRPNTSRIFSKFYCTYNVEEFDRVIMTLKDELHEDNFFAKLQAI